MKELRISTVVIDPFGSPVIPIEESVGKAAEIFGGIGIRLVHQPCEPIEIGFMANLDVDSCSYRALTREQQTLFGLRDGIDDKTVALYFVQTTKKPYHGCSKHPPNVPAAVLTAQAPPWTLAHEIGHVLELGHRSGVNALMNKATVRLVDVPALSAREIEGLLRSPLLTEVTT